MTVRPLYHFDDPVTCWACDKTAGTARDGDVVGFGDGNGNRELKCACGHLVVYDVTKSVDRARSHMEAVAETLAACRQALKTWLARKTGAKRKAKPAEPPGVFAAKPPGVFGLDYGALINQELRK